MNRSKFFKYMLILALIAPALACSIPLANSAPTPPPQPTRAIGSMPTTAAGTSATGLDFSHPISLTDDGDYYRSSTGGNLKNGCEGWQSMLKTGETIFTGRCDAKRLEELSLYSSAALGFNQSEPAPRQIAASDSYIMMDYETEKSQALFGATANKADAYIIMNYQKEYIYYRAYGSKDQLKELNFLVDALLAANDSVNDSVKVKLSGDKLNVAEDKLTGNQLLVGKTSAGKTVALFVDKNGKYLGYGGAK